MGHREGKRLGHSSRAGGSRKREQRDPRPRAVVRELPSRPLSRVEGLGRLGHERARIVLNGGGPVTEAQIRAKKLQVGNRREGPAQPAEQSSFLRRHSAEDPQGGHQKWAVSPRLHQV